MKETRTTAAGESALLNKIRETGIFKPLEDSKKDVLNDHSSNSSNSSATKANNRFQYICMGNVNAAKTRILISEKCTPHERWSTSVLKQAPPDVVKKVEDIAHQQPKNKKMLSMSSKDFTFDVKSQITRVVKKLDGSAVQDQLVNEMPLHQFRFDDQIFSLMSMIPILFNHASALDADQLVNMFLPFSSNPEKEGRICIIQPSKGHLPFILDLLRYIYAMNKRLNRIFKDDQDVNHCHMDKAQGLMLFKVLSKFNTSTGKHRNEMFNLLFDKKNGSIGGIYEDMKHFPSLYPKAEQTFKRAISEIYVQH